MTLGKLGNGFREHLAAIIGYPANIMSLVTYFLVLSSAVIFKGMLAER